MTPFSELLRSSQQEGKRLLREIEEASATLARAIEEAYGEECQVDFLKEHGLVMVRTRRYP